MVARLNTDKEFSFLTVDLKELAGEHHKGCGVRFNLTQRRESHQRRRQDEGQSKGLTQRAER
jgi:hypothetical protein